MFNFSFHELNGHHHDTPKALDWLRVRHALCGWPNCLHSQGRRQHNALLHTLMLYNVSRGRGQTPKDFIVNDLFIRRRQSIGNFLKIRIPNGLFHAWEARPFLARWE